jgi:hypothetical protein
MKRRQSAISAEIVQQKFSVRRSEPDDNRKTQNQNHRQKPPDIAGDGGRNRQNDNRHRRQTLIRANAFEKSDIRGTM